MPHAVDFRRSVGPFENTSSPSVMCGKPQIYQIFVCHLYLNPNQPRYVKVFEIHKHALIFMDQCISKAWKVG